MKEWPKFSIVMATLNSMRTLEAALKALRAQDYPAELVEILVVDGGSTDGTRELASRYQCRVLDNPRVEPVSAKLIGLREATGRYLMHVDSDEVLTSPQALKMRANLYHQHPEIKMIFSAGYANPPGAPFAARYINEYGDPFSMFYYRLSKDHRFFMRDIRRLCDSLQETTECSILQVRSDRQPIMENAACANCIDLEFFRQNFAELCDKPWGPVHFFYHMQKFTLKFAITKNESVVHHSADHWSSFLKKIKWRVRNNVFFLSDLGASGFSGRQQFETGHLAWKKYAYIPYAFLVLPALMDALSHMWTRRDWAYWLHLPLTLYTAGLIVAMKFAKAFGYRPVLKSYGEQKSIATGPGPSQALAGVKKYEG